MSREPAHFCPSSGREQHSTCRRCGAVYICVYLHGRGEHKHEQVLEAQAGYNTAHVGGAVRGCHGGHEVRHGHHAGTAED